MLKIDKGVNTYITFETASKFPVQNLVNFLVRLNHLEDNSLSSRNSMNYVRDPKLNILILHFPSLSKAL